MTGTGYSARTALWHMISCLYDRLPMITVTQGQVSHFEPASYMLIV